MLVIDEVRVAQGDFTKVLSAHSRKATAHTNDALGCRASKVANCVIKEA
jgi:hypothetical protein